jgi:hypothetical protein
MVLPSDLEIAGAENCGSNNVGAKMQSRCRTDRGLGRVGVSALSSLDRVAYLPGASLCHLSPTSESDSSHS